MRRSEEVRELRKRGCGGRGVKEVLPESRQTLTNTQRQIEEQLD